MALVEELAARTTAIYGPGHSLFSITPADDTPLTTGPGEVPLRAIYIGTEGDLTGKTYTAKGLPETITLRNIRSGTLLEIAFIEVHATGTTATDIVGIL